MLVFLPLPSFTPLSPIGGKFTLHMFKVQPDLRGHPALAVGGGEPEGQGPRNPLSFLLPRVSRAGGRVLLC